MNSKHWLVVLSFCVFTLLHLPYAISQEVKTEALSDKMFQTLRNADNDQITKILDKHPEQLEARNFRGETPLILSAFYSPDAECIKLLLKRGADVNAKDKYGVTALMQISASAEKAEVLLDAGADVNAKSDAGNTALTRAAIFKDSFNVVKLMVDHGAEVNKSGFTPIHAAAKAGNIDSLHYLFNHGAIIDNENRGGGRSALVWAVENNQIDTVKLLVKNGATINPGSLRNASERGYIEIVRYLLDQGADVNAGNTINTPLISAIISELSNHELIQLLINRGADVNVSAANTRSERYMYEPQTALKWALRKGDHKVASLLQEHGAKIEEDTWAKRKPTPPHRNLPKSPFPSKYLSQVVVNAIQPLQHSAIESYKDFSVKENGGKCNSCHNQHLPMMALSAMKENGIPRDEEIAETLVKYIDNSSKDRDYKKLKSINNWEPSNNGFGTIGRGFSLMSLHGEGVKSHRFIDAIINRIAADQMHDGKWRNDGTRTPMVSSYFQSTAWSIQAFSLYPLPGKKQEMDQQVELGVQWLKKNSPTTPIDRVYQLLGLSWAGIPAEELQELANHLLDEQKEDGGWSQRDNLKTDAYATSLSLYALHESVKLSTKHTAYQKGIRYLLSNQLEDGTWFVQRRTRAFQPTMEPHFPHGRDAWISSATTSWAIMALCEAIDPEEIKDVEFTIPKITRPNYDELLPPPAKQKVDFEKDIRPVLDTSCVGCHSGKKPESNYSVETHESLFAKGKQGYLNIIPGDSANSRLVHFVAGLKVDVEMPPPAVRDVFSALTDEEIGLIRAWIDQGVHVMHKSDTR